MKHTSFIILLTSFLILSACQKTKEDTSSKSEASEPISETNDIAAKTLVKKTDMTVPLNGRITIKPDPLISEDAACIMPLRVSNGTDGPIAVSMFGFKVTGDGDDDMGNMFAQKPASGQASIARVILIGQSCTAFNQIIIPEVLCVSDDKDCPVKVDFENSAELSLIGPE